MNADWVGYVPLQPPLKYLTPCGARFGDQCSSLFCALGRVSDALSPSHQPLFHISRLFRHVP
jgi:hypothetical protein